MGKHFNKTMHIDRVVHEGGGQRICGFRKNA